MKTRLCIVALTLLFAAVSSLAQDAPRRDAPASPSPRPAPPVGPLLKPAPDFSAWEIAFIYPEDSSGKATTTAGSTPAVNRTENARRLRQVNTTKTGKIIHEVSMYASGKQVDTWHDGKIQYQKQAGAGFWVARNGTVLDGTSTDNSYVAFPNSGFRDLDWVTDKTYVATVPYGDRACLVFVQTGANKIDTNDPARLKQILDGQEVVAYVDAETRLPISHRIGKILRVYKFTAPPSEMQTFPPDLAGEIKRGEDARTRVNTMAPRPY